MSTQDEENLFENSFHEWLEVHGVELVEHLDGTSKFHAYINLNMLKTAIMFRENSIREQARGEGRIRGIIEALEGVNQQHYGYRGELVIDTYLSLKDKLRPEGEDPAYSLPVGEAIEFYKAKLDAFHSTNNSSEEK